MANTIKGLLDEYRATHGALHRCWTKAVGTADYVKADWKTLDNALESRFRDAATALGYDGPLIIPTARAT